MKSVLCYGDSLTWGFDAPSGGRHAYEDRWPSVLEAGLDGKARVFAEGLNGRTTAFDDDLVAADRNGARLLPTLLATHAPLDLVILMLGSNDMKPWIHGNPRVASLGVARLVDIVRGNGHLLAAPGAQAVLVVSPPLIERNGQPDFEDRLGNADAASGRLAAFYRTVAEEKRCGFFDASSVAKACSMDGVHMDAENTRALGRALVPVVRTMLEAGTGGCSG